MDLYPYQRKGVRKISHFGGRALLADDMGLGKTAQALSWAAEDREDRMPMVVVCPAHLKGVWEAEARNHIRQICYVAHGQTPPAHGLPPTSLLIINYDILRWWMDVILAGGFRTLAVDEVHYCKSAKARRTKYVKILSRQIPYMVGISGTPLTNRPSELWPALNMLRPKEYKSLWTFAKEYCQLRRGRWGWEYTGAKNLDRLHAELSHRLMIRRMKKDVLQDLPPKTRAVVPVEISNWGEYEKARDEFLKWLTQQSPEKADRARRAQSLVRMGYLKRLAGELKLKAAMDWIDDYLEETDRKLVVFGIHKAVLRAIEDRYKKQCVVLTGDTPPAERRHVVERFQKNPRTRLFIGNIQAAGTGLTLTAASDLVFLEIGWTPGEHTQAEDRIHRIGQENHANIYYLVAKGTIEESLMALLEKKFGVLGLVLDNTTGDFNLMAQLEKEISK